MATFCILVYFPSWLEIQKKHNKITNRAKNLLNLVRRCHKFPNKKISEISLKCLQRNAFFAHQENVILGMLADEDSDNRRIAVNKILNIRKNVENISEENSHNYNEAEGVQAVRKFVVPTINVKARSLKKFVNLDSNDITEPPFTISMTNEFLEEILENPLQLGHPCHNQAVERHVKLVTESCSAVSSYEERDGLIRQRIQSRKLMKVYDTKGQFAL